jgi:catechol 2,3-dioxygenase-like lactoylglutathione lyase family enzyme
MGSVVAVNHIGVSVADLDAARAFWTALGFTEVTGWTWGPGTTPADEALALEGTAATVSIMAAPSSFLELFAFTSPAPTTRDLDSPGIREVTVAVGDLSATTAALGDLGHGVVGSTTTCPDGTTVRLVEGALRGLRRVLLRVPDPQSSPLLAVAPDAPVSLEAVDGGSGAPARSCDLGANHVCLDVEGIAGVRGAFGDGIAWHQSVVSSSGGIASVCYGTTVDGVLVELLESHSPDATLHRSRLAQLP